MGTCFNKVQTTLAFVNHINNHSVVIDFYKVIKVRRIKF